MNDLIAKHAFIIYYKNTCPPKMLIYALGFCRTSIRLNFELSLVSFSGA